jgi:hypothetical protein
MLPERHKNTPFLGTSINSTRQPAASTLHCERWVAVHKPLPLVIIQRNRREGVPTIFVFFCPGLKRGCGKRKAAVMAHRPGKLPDNKVLNIHGRNQNRRNGPYNLFGRRIVRWITGNG